MLLIRMTATIIIIIYLLFRLVAKFNVCYEFIVFGLMFWALLSISSALLVSNSIIGTIVE